MSKRKPLTDAEMREIEESDKAFAERERAWPGRRDALLKELNGCKKLSPLAVEALDDLVARHLMTSREGKSCLLLISQSRKLEHWQLLYTLLEIMGLGWNAAVKKASEVTGVSEQTIKKDYAYINRELPPEFRRKKTYKKKKGH